MILVTIGTNEQPFDRLVLAAAALELDEPVIVQYGSSRAVEPRDGWMEFLPFDELSELAKQARVVVCHAGVGSILMARRAGKLPVVMARRHGLGEAVDDHQVELSRRLAASGLVTLVDDEKDLAEAVRTATGTGGETVVRGLPGADALASDLRLQLQRLAA
jgi:UDP-N-acetylglucosamine transferase subunit ALG13